MNTKTGKRSAISHAERRRIANRKVLANTVRSMYQQLGNTRGTAASQNRNMNQECGYPDTIVLQDIIDLYEREGVAKRVVQVYPVETWKNHPEIYETNEPGITEFEEAVDKLIRTHNIFSVLERADILSGIGYFGVILLGLNDGKELKEPVAGFANKPLDMLGYELERPEKPLKLMYMKVFDQRQVEIASLETDDRKERYGRPVMYRIKMSSVDENGQVTTKDMKEVDVHWTRVIHLADNLESSDIIGVPRLRPAYNRVWDLLKVIGGSGEMFWRGGFPGLAFQLQPNLQLAGVAGTDFNVAEFQEEVEKYANGLQRYLRVVGLEVKSLAPQVADPTPHVDAGLDQVCITLNCPKRIFLGTESAHLASTQDQKTWSDRIDGRRENYAIPHVVRPVFRRFISFGILPFVADFHVHWKDPEEVDPLVRAQAFEKIVNAMSQYVSSGLATLVPPIEFLTQFLLLKNDDAERIVKAAMEQAKAPDSEKLPLVQATSELDAQKDALEKQTELKSQQMRQSAATKAGPNGRKAGTGRRREVRDRSTGQNGG